MNKANHQLGRSMRFRRNTYRGRVGGVCAGLADYTGLNLTLLRTLCVSSFFFGGLGLWIYLILWIAVPAKASVPLSGASLRLRWTLYRIGRLVSQLHRTASPAIADLGQEAYDALRALAPQIDRSQPASFNPTLAKIGLQDFPETIRHLLYEDADHQGNLLTPLETINRTLKIRLNPLIARTDSDLSAPHQTSIQHLRELGKKIIVKDGVKVAQMLEGIEQNVTALLSSSSMDITPLFSEREKYEIERIAQVHLPDTLEQYIKLQGPFSGSLELRNGKTAEMVLIEQLTLFDQILGGYRKTLFEHELRDFLIQGRFLKDKFRQTDNNSGSNVKRETEHHEQD
jgi:phage shock protein PspC (stress-responsive transcriptional regulator)